VIQKININDLPKLKSGCQRDYIDRFFFCGPYYILALGSKARVVGVKYGHCEHYPRGFDVEVEIL
jgi:hypothetical protein